MQRVAVISSLESRSAAEAVEEPSQTGLRSAAFLCAAMALGWAIHHAKWSANEDSFRWAAISFACVVFGVVASSFLPDSRLTRAFATPLLCAAYGFQLTFLARNTPGYGEPLQPWFFGIAVLLGLGLWGSRVSERWRIPALAGIFWYLGHSVIKTSPAPDIDVWVWHNEAIRALLDGKNPYTMTMPNIYPDVRFYDPSMVQGSRVNTGYQYPPMSLLLIVPGYLFGDCRYSLLFAMVGAVVCLASARPGSLAAPAICLWLFTPRTLFVLEQAWTEPFVVFFLAATVMAAIRWPRYTFIPLGMLLAVKHYVALALPLVWLLPVQKPRGHIRLVLEAAAVGGIFTLPFLLASPVALFSDLVLFQLKQPFRPESLSVLGYWATHHGKQLPSWLSFASLFPAMGLALWRCERSPAGFAAAIALVFFCFFGFAKQAFCNYYFFVLGAICCAVAAAPTRRTG